MHLQCAAARRVLPQHGLRPQEAVLLREGQEDAGHGLDLGLHVLGRTRGGEERLGPPPQLLHLPRRAAAHRCAVKLKEEETIEHFLAVTHVREN